MIKTRSAWLVISSLLLTLGCITPIFGPFAQPPSLHAPGITQLKPSTEAHFTSLAWSPDSTRLAVTYAEPSSASAPMPPEESIYQIQILDIDSGETKMIDESNPGLRSAVAWLPNDRIAFYANNDLEDGTWRMPADGLGTKEMVIKDVVVSWSTDGKMIAYWRLNQEAQPNMVSLYVQDLESGKTREVFQYKEKYITRVDLEWSPGGNHILFTFGASSSDPVQSIDIYNLDLPSEKATKLTNAGFYRSITWSPDEKLVAYSYEEKNILPYQESLYAMKSDGSCRIRLTETADEYGEFEWLSWSPNGRWIAFIWNNGIYLLDTEKVPNIDLLKNGSACP
jgi:Tol biopolymer transport system component